MKVLIPGGAGYIGSTIASACIDAGHEPIIIDDLSTGVRAFTIGRTFYQGDIADGYTLRHALTDHHDIDALVHCAARIQVPESITRPLEYYDTNVAKTVAMLEVLTEFGCTKIIFSSSAALYGAASTLAIAEDEPVAPRNPYGRTKAMVEDILRDGCSANLLSAISLRYFNPVGTDPLQRTGPGDVGPKNVLDLLATAHMNKDVFTIAGTDWPSHDGTAIRDYVHVWDLAQAHLAAIHRLAGLPHGTYEAINIGTGRGTSVRELATAFQQVTDGRPTVVEGARRPGDVLGGYASIDLAQRTLGWSPRLTLDDSIHNILQWRTSQPPRGHAQSP